MVQYSGLPEELKTLFGNTLIPPETRIAITNYWNKIGDLDRQQLIIKISNEQDSLKRVLIALMETATNKLTFSDVKRIIGEHLKTALNVLDFKISFAKQEDDSWKVNVVYVEKFESISLNQDALFRIDSRTGEVKEFQKGRYWTG